VALVRVPMQEEAAAEEERRALQAKADAAAREAALAQVCPSANPLLLAPGWSTTQSGSNTRCALLRDRLGL
jgi:hypothetical protein